MWRRAFAWVVAGCLALLLGTAAAHPMPESQVWLDTTPDGLTVTLKLPLDRLEVGFGQPLADTPAADLLVRQGPALSRYLLAHVGARTASASSCATTGLLFLLVLMLAAPLLRTPDGRDWGDARAPRDAVRQRVPVVTGFTLGHSLTLALGSTGIVRVPVQPVEVLVATSIVVGAWHAWRPLRFGSEVGMAAGFGLVHGLAFSASLDGAGLTAWQHAQALLAFNLGIESAQVLLVMPGLLWLAHHRPGGYAGLQRVDLLA